MNNQLYNLTLSQKLNLTGQKYNPKRQVMNIPTTLLLEREISFDMLRKAAELAVSRNDCFRLRLTKDRKEVKQFFTDGEHPQFEIWDFKAKTEEDMLKAIHKVASKRITLMDKPLYQIFLLRDFHGWCGLYVNLSHMIMDSYAVGVFYNDFLHCLYYLEGKEEMPKPLYPYKDHLIWELADNVSENHKKDLEWWDKDTQDNPHIFTHPAGPERLEKTRAKKKDPNFTGVSFLKMIHWTYGGQRIIRTVPRDVVDGISAYCNKSGQVTPVVFYQIAQYGYLARMCGTDRATMTNVSNMRGKLSQRFTGGCLVHANQLNQIFDWSKSFADQAAACQARQFAFMRHASPCLDETMALIAKHQHLSPLDFVSSGMLSFQIAGANMTQCDVYHTMWHHNGGYNNPLSVTVMDDDGSGAWRVYYDLMTGSISAEACETMHNRILAFFRLALADDSRTMEDLWTEAMKIQ